MYHIADFVNPGDLKRNPRSTVNLRGLDLFHPIPRIDTRG